MISKKLLAFNHKSLIINSKYQLALSAFEVLLYLHSCPTLGVFVDVVQTTVVAFEVSNCV